MIARLPPPRALGGAARTLDVVFRPLMWVLAGGQADGRQETHIWHRQDIDAGAVDAAQAVLVDGDDRSWVRTNRIVPFPFFHAPVFGGWRNYVVLEVQTLAPVWHVGWVHRRVPMSARPIAAIHRLPIRDRRVRMLRQPEGFQTDFFAVDPHGRQLPLVLVGQGRLGQGQYLDVRLF